MRMTNPPEKATPLHLAVRVTKGKKHTNGIIHKERDNTITKGKQTIKVDEIYTPEMDNDYIYNKRINEILEGVLVGEHGCVIVYGTAGSGKSYTMMGSPHNYGVIPRAIDQIYGRISELQRKHGMRCQFAVKISYLQLLDEVISDIINPLNIHISFVTQQGAVRVHGAEEVEAQREAAMELVDVGLENQSTHHRASTIFRVSVERRELMEDGSTLIHSAQLHLVDLGCVSPPTAKEDSVSCSGLHSLTTVVKEQVCKKLT